MRLEYQCQTRDDEGLLEERTIVLEIADEAAELSEWLGSWLTSVQLVEASEPRAELASGSFGWVPDLEHEGP